MTTQDYTKASIRLAAFSRIAKHHLKSHHINSFVIAYFDFFKTLKKKPRQL